MDAQIFINNSLKNFEIPEGYNLFFKSPSVNQISDAQIFCLPEIHTYRGERQQRLNARLIDRTVEINPDKRILVLVESVESLKPVNQKGHEQVYYCKKELEVRGWDLGSQSETLIFSDQLRILHRKIDEANEHWQIVKHPIINGIPMPQEQVNQIILLTVKAKATLDELRKEYKEKHALEGHTNEDFINKLVITFPIRNSKMRETIDKVVPFYDIIFVIAGARHFIPHPNPSKDNVLSHLDIKPLHEFFGTQKTVILEHKT